MWSTLERQQQMIAQLQQVINHQKQNLDYLLYQQQPSLSPLPMYPFNYIEPIPMAREPNDMMADWSKQMQKAAEIKALLNLIRR